MTAKRFLNLKILSKGLNVFGIALIISGSLLSLMAKPTQAGNDDKVTICHAAGRAGTTQFVTLTISYNAAFGQAGHFNENGTPKAGHEDDYLGACATDTVTSTATATATFTSTATTAATTTATPTDDDRKVTICHAAGQDGTTQFVTLTIGYNAVYGPAGHFYENGTPRAGHEDDSLGACPTSTATATATETETATETKTATATETETATATATETATATTTATATAIAPDALSVSYVCLVTSMNWSVTNPNEFDVTFDWEVDPSVAGIGSLGGKFFSAKAVVVAAAVASGTDVAPAGSSVVFYSSTPATHVVRISYTLPDATLPTISQVTNGNDFCKPKDVDPTGTSIPTQETPVIRVLIPVTGSTPVPTLQKPIAQSGQILIPVTGVDLGDLVSGAQNKSGRLMMNYGFALLGLGLVLQGFAKKI